MEEGKNRKVLVTSCGGFTGTYLTKHFFALGVPVVGVDMSDDVPLKDMLECFFTVPASKDPHYIDTIRDIVLKENITHIIPVSSYDMVIFSKFVTDPFLGKRMIIVDSEVNKTFHNKKNCYSFLSKIGVETPFVYELDNVAFPAIYKPCEGSGSKSVIRIDDVQELEYWKQKNNQDSLCMEYIDGDEFTVDCLFNAVGKNCGFNIRRRMKVGRGSAVVSENDYRYCEQVKCVVSKIEEYGKVVGPINFQFKMKNGEVCIFDFNTRLASGGLPLTVATGFDIPLLLLDCIDGKTVPKWDCKKSGKDLKMIRYYEEVFV